MFKAKTFENFITKRDADALIRFAETIEFWDNDQTDDFWNNRSLNGVTIEKYNKDIAMYLWELRQRMGKAIAEAYNEEAVYPDLMQIVRWFPGQEQHPHSDDMTEHQDESMSYFWNRHYGSILYLNDDYEGGHTYYPQHDFEIIPKAGMLAVHPGSPDHMHGVTTIQNKTRYTIAAFWSRNKDHYDGWEVGKPF